MNNQANDATLLGFNALDLRSANIGDIVVFRTGSLTHSQDLPLRHGCYGRVKGFAKSSKGAQQVQVEFKDGVVIPMAPSNLVARSSEIDDLAPQARQLVERIVRHCAENNRNFMAVPSLQVALGELGMYDRLREPANATSAEGQIDLPF